MHKGLGCAVIGSGILIRDNPVRTISEGSMSNTYKACHRCRNIVPSAAGRGTGGMLGGFAVPALFAQWRSWQWLLIELWMREWPPVARMRLL
jgi:hypothetical protein